ncbi:hypothetical protein E5676_scaffold37G00330 [Cucumis melo var. makuwa]|uniref:Uncharacterized protein n=1 Tax=Cucumis melo var. makuwa TaxID=1194695 RepID=A0A5D3BGR4_CUCMM|nr:hypothetical protein E5676_scaffold37G00330 [Cucumis melo var. makuwa]
MPDPRLFSTSRADSYRKSSRFLLSSRADSPVFEPSACSGPCTYFGPPRCNHDLGTPRLGKRVFLLLGLVEQISRCMLAYPIRVIPTWVSFGITTYLGLCHRRPDFVPTGSHVARVRERASSWVEAEVRARASWQATRSDRGEP